MPITDFVARAHAHGVLVLRVDSVISLRFQRPKPCLWTKLRRIRNAAVRFLNEVIEA